MSKRNKERKAQARATAEARKLTTGKMLRLLLKSLAFALTVGILFTFAAAAGIPYIDQTWVQIALILGIYIVAYPFLMSEFRPKRSRDKD